MRSFDALRLLDAFGKVGAATFSLTIKTLTGKNLSFRRQLTFENFRQMMPALLDRAENRRHNLIVRPHSPRPGPVFIQLDDLTHQDMERVRPVSFLGLLTSRGKYQAWLAILYPVDADFVRRIRERVGACRPTVSGARLASSWNFQKKYAHNFPQVRIAHFEPGCIITPGQIGTLRFVAPPRKALSASERSQSQVRRQGRPKVLIRRNGSRTDVKPQTLRNSI
jgi:hypothetical protein